MANIGIDPHTLEAPDYASATYVESRQPLVEAGMTEEQAVAALLDISKSKLSNDELDKLSALIEQARKEGR